jgi:hypothetical protein
MIPVRLGECLMRDARVYVELELHFRGGMKESGIGRENGVEAYESCEWGNLAQLV